MKKTLVFLMVLGLGIMMLGCNNSTEPPKEADNTVQETKKNTSAEANQEAPEQGEQNEEKKEEKNEQTEIKNDSEDSGDHEAQDQILRLYYIADSGEIECSEMRTNFLQTTDVWNGLLGEGVLGDGCKMNNCTVNQDEKIVYLDVDSGTGSYIRSMGTTGEEQILTCITNSFLKTYGCEKLKITENGQVLETGHAVIKGYMTASE